MKFLKNLQQQCDRCVKCGMCLSVCPTYQIAQRETESPRGRIAMLQALSENQLQVSTELVAHLDNCLQCRACESICPSGVSYGQIIELGQSLIHTHKRRNAGNKAFWHVYNRLLGLSSGFASLNQLIWLYKISGLQKLTALLAFNGGSTLARAGRYFAAAHTTLPATDIPTARLHSAKISLFPGCLSQTLQAQTVAAATSLLQTLGYEVEIHDGCCGGLHARDGDLARSSQLLNAALDTLPRGQTVVSLVSACSGRLASANLEQNPVLDFITFLAKHEGGVVKFKPLNKTIAVHESCSLRNVLKEQKHLYSLLNQIPGATIIPLKDNAMCCGAGGTHMLSHPQQADQLLKPKIENLAELQADILVSTNLGCALHFQAGVKNKLPVQIMHPAALLASLI